MKLHISWTAGEDTIDFDESDKTEWKAADRQGRKEIVDDYLMDLLTAGTIEAFWGIEE